MSTDFLLVYIFVVVEAIVVVHDPGPGENSDISTTSMIRRLRAQYSSPTEIVKPY
jgi:hypothetical protein